ncbi:MAG: caspase family protein, partial [Rhodomicrobium sp.]
MLRTVIQVFICFLLLGSALAAHADTRLALLIGNQNYSATVGPLKNPHQDVALIEASLKKLGFTVTVLRDADYRAMDIALKRYVRELRGAGPGALGFFYYSGHGAANAETQINYLIPTDVASAEDNSIWDQSFQQHQIIGMLSSQAKQATQFVVFDACRNELHLSAPAAKAIGAEKGFVPVASTPGLLIAYATAPNQTASDAGDGGGPYAKVLAEELLKPGVEAVEMFRHVQIRVKQTIGQDPWLSFPSLAPVYLAGREQAAPAGPLPADAQAWSLVQNSGSEAVLEEYIRRFPDSVYAGFAKARLEELKANKPTSWWPWSAGKPAEAGKPQDAQAPAAPAEPALAPKDTQVAVVAPLPAPAVPAEPACDGLLVAVASGKSPCIKPGSGKSFQDCPDCPEMVIAPAGSFSMGSPGSEPEQQSNESPQHVVRIGEPFAVGRFAETRDEFEAFVKDSGHSLDGGCYVWTGSEWKQDSAKSFRSPGFAQTGSHPVVCVNWNDAQAYVAWLS